MGSCATCKHARKAMDEKPCINCTANNDHYKFSRINSIRLHISQAIKRFWELWFSGRKTK